MARSKTAAIKQRAVFVYLPSIEMAERWKRAARKRNHTLSGFIIETVENSLSNEDDGRQGARE